MRSERIRILHLIDSYRIGGPGKTIINSARFIDLDRFEILVASFAPADESANEFGQAVRSAGIPYFGLKESRGLNSSQIRAIADLVDKEQVGILHTHGYKPDILGLLVRRKVSGVGLFTTHHGWIENSWTQKLYTRAAIAGTRKFDGVACVASHLQQQLPRGVARSNRSAVIHNALVLQDYKPAGLRREIRSRLGVKDDQVLVGVVGRLSPEKGCMEALEAFGRLKARAGNVRLVMVGEGPLESALRTEVLRRGLGEAVFFPGHQPAVLPWFEALDLLLSPSRTEGLSNVLLEAQAMRRPVIATRVGGNAEIIEHEVNGLLVEPLRPDQMSAALELLLSDPGYSSRLVESGYKTVTDRFGFETRMRSMEAFYEKRARNMREAGACR